jgi:alkylated DNA repair dioxygenase AlkB
MLPPGAHYIPDFISPVEERALVRALDCGAWDVAMKRRVQHFGHRYDYRARRVAGAAFLGPLPNWLSKISALLVQKGFFEDLPDQVIANEYLPGQGISAHVDCVPCFAGSIASLSLLSACEMAFRNSRTGEMASTMLEPCSLLLLTGAARYEWTHAIPARRSDIVDGLRRPRARRVSLTFRSVTPAVRSSAPESLHPSLA